MTTDRVDETVVTEGETVVADGTTLPAGGEVVRTASSRTISTSPSTPELTRRIVVFVFGLIQLIIVLRFVLLLLDAREANGLVSGILDISQIFVGPFDGILRTDNVHAAGSVFDLTAIVALVGWTIIELIVIWLLNIFRREPV